MKHLWSLNKHLMRYKWRLLFGIFFVAVNNVFAIFPVQVIRNAFDLVLETVETYQLLNGYTVADTFYDNLTTTLLYMGGLVLLFAILKGIFLFFTRLTIIIMSRLIEYDLKNEVFDHYQKLNLSFYKQQNTGDLMNRISEDVSRVRMYFGPAIMYTINLLVLFIFVIITMLSINVKLTLYVLTPLPVLSLSIYYVSKMINVRSEKVQAQLSRLNTFVQEAFSGIRVIKAYSREHEKDRFFKKECETYRDKNLDLVRVNAFFMPLMILLIGLSTILTIYIGGKLAIAGEITMGNIAEFVIYVNMLTWPVASLGWVTSLVQRAAASQERINEFLDTKPAIVNTNTAPSVIEGNITFDHVTFRYPNTNTPALDNISFTLKKGHSLAIIGRTGSGKSTIANLILRLFDTEEGRILIDGKDIKGHNLDALRENIGYVPQEVFLFSDTLAQNVAFGLKSEKVDMEQVRWAAKNADVLENIEQFPKGFDTYIGERGITLSGGQKQRLSIARALIKRPKILILDDCLSAVDTNTERKILDNLEPIMKDKTSIIIGHRVSSMQHCDHIIYLDDGRIVEEGNHEALMKKQGAYYDLYQTQLVQGDSSEEVA